MTFDPARLRAWTAVPAPRFVGGNRVELLQGGDALFPRMEAAIDAAEREVWLATYIFHDDPAATLDDMPPPTPPEQPQLGCRP